MTFDEVTTMFHEFGHAMHGLFANQQYPSLSGTNTARDFVEFPSQFHENLATVPEILEHYATPLPDRRGDPARAGRQDRGRGATSTRGSTSARCSRPRCSTWSGTR